MKETYNKLKDFTARTSAVPLKQLSAVVFVFFAAACHKDNNSAGNSGNTLLQNKWTLISRTGNFPTSPYPFNGFHETDSPNDYFTFGKNDTVYSFVTAYMPFGTDTVSYKASPNSITFYVNQRQNGFLFETQDTLGHLHDTTVAQILALNDNLLVLSFPSIEPITNLVAPGITTYFQGTLIDSLKR
jgi:hypothetical protein